MGFPLHHFNPGFGYTAGFMKSESSQSLYYEAIRLAAHFTLNSITGLRLSNSSSGASCVNNYIVHTFVTAVPFKQKVIDLSSVSAKGASWVHILCSVGGPFHFLLRSHSSIFIEFSRQPQPIYSLIKCTPQISRRMTGVI